MARKRGTKKRTCEGCGAYSEEKLTKHKGEWHCRECVCGPMRPIELSTISSYMGMWDEATPVGYGEGE